MIEKVYAYGAKIFVTITYLITSLTFLTTWRVPSYFGDNTLKTLISVMLIEFFIIHAAFFLGIMSFRDNSFQANLFFPLIIFYIIFAAAISKIFNIWWPLISFICFLIPKIVTIFNGENSGDHRAMNFQRWIKNAITYIGVAFFFTAFPVPQWGITSAIQKAQAITGAGIWTDHPERVLAMGFFYFLILSLTEFFSPINKNLQTSKIPSQTDDDHEFLKSGIVIKSFTDGSKRYTFKMARYLSGLFFTFFIFLGFLGATILLMSGDWIGNILGILVCLLIDVVLFGYLCLELFEKYYVRIEKDTVVLRGGIFGIGHSRKINFQNLFKVQQHTSKFGERGLLSISILTKSGKKYLAARNVGPLPQANKLADDMVETLSKLGWRNPTPTTISKSK